MPRSMTDLVKWCEPSSTVLLLGAGVAIPSGAPSWAGLRDELVRRLHPNLTVEGELPLIADILEREFGRRLLVEQVQDIVDIEPVGGILGLPKYPWRAIYSTNYDRLIERSAQACNVTCAVVRSRYDLPLLEDRAKLPLFKIHGCVTQDRAFGDPSSMIITKTDYRKVRKWKEDLLRRMQTDMESGQVLIIGHSLNDPHLDELIDDVLALQEEIGFRGKVAVLLFSAPAEVQAMYEARGLQVTVGDIDWFVSQLATVRREQPSAREPGADADGSILTDTLAAITIDVSSAVRLETPARKMFSGAPASYYDIAQGRTFERDAVPGLLSNLRKDKVAVIVGAAGFGKTTLARQVALGRRNEGLQVWEHRTDLPLDVDEWFDVNARLVAAKRSALLVLDNITTYQRSVNELLKRLSRASEIRLEILATAERHRWARLIKNPRLVAREPHRPSRLSRPEVRRLIRLSRENDDIRGVIPANFFSLSEAQQLSFLERQCAGDIFICLRNIFFSAGFDTIVLEEYASLDGDLQEIYRVVAALEAVAGGSHRQLVLRMIDLDYQRISEILDDLSGLMAETSMNQADGIYVWRTRHPEIADIIARYKYANPDSHLALIRDLVDNLRPTIDIEKNAIRGLCNNPLGIDFIRDDAARLDIIERLVELLPQDHVLRHRLVREFVRGGSHAEAEQVLERAISDVGIDPPLLRYRIELYRLRAQDSADLMREDREALLRWAWVECQAALDQYSDNWYTYRSLAEVAIDWYSLTRDATWLSEAKTELLEAQGRLYEPELDRFAARVESLLLETPGLHP